jgi:hypothetical protein
MVKLYLNIASRLCSFALASAWITLVAAARAEESGQTIRADVVALDQPFMLNRLGASLPQGMIFALKPKTDPCNMDSARRPSIMDQSRCRIGIRSKTVSSNPAELMSPRRPRINRYRPILRLRSLSRAPEALSDFACFTQQAVPGTRMGKS